MKWTGTPSSVVAVTSLTLCFASQALSQSTLDFNLPHASTNSVWLLSYKAVQTELGLNNDVARQVMELSDAFNKARSDQLRKTGYTKDLAALDLDKQLTKDERFSRRAAITERVREPMKVLTAEFSIKLLLILT